MKIKRFLSLSLIFFVAFSIFITMTADISFASSAKRFKREAKEVERIKRFEGIVKRDGDRLLLKSKSGTYIVLKNSPGCEKADTCVDYRFIDYFEGIGFFLVKGYYREEVEHIMIPKSGGKKFHIHDLPEFSPDKSVLLTVPDSTNTGYNENGVFIWRVEGAKLIPEFSFEPEEYVWYKLVRWKDNRSAELTKWFLSSKGPCSGQDYTVVPVELKREGGGWRLNEDSSPRSIECIGGWYDDRL